MRIYVDPSHLDALRDFLARAAWDVQTDGDALVARGDPALTAAAAEEQLRLTLGVWHVMYPTLDAPRLNA